MNIVKDNTDMLFDPSFLDRLIQHSRLLGFDRIGISDTKLSYAEKGLLAWLKAGFHGEMHYMADRGLMRARPEELYPGTISIISVRLPYLPLSILESSFEKPNDRIVDVLLQASSSPKKLNDWRSNEWRRLSDPLAGNISLYARGRDYHKVFRQRLKKLAEFIISIVSPFRYRVFCDSAPVMEVALAERAGLGWRGKNTLLLDREAGSFFFLGEIFTNLKLPFLGKLNLSNNCRSLIKPTSIDSRSNLNQQVLAKKLKQNFPLYRKDFSNAEQYCGSCQRCINICPTQAIIAPYHLDARRCISYLTIEFKGIIPLEMRPKIGNRIYGCDDCQLICPWNKFAQTNKLVDFEVRNNLDKATALELFMWSEREFLTRMEGSAIRRIGYEQWLRNIAIVLGNALATELLSSDYRKRILDALRMRLLRVSALVTHHIDWAINQN